MTMPPPPPRSPIGMPPASNSPTTKGPRLKLNWNLPSNFLSYSFLALSSAFTLTAFAVVVIYFLSYADVTNAPMISWELAGYALGGILGPIVLGVNSVIQRKALQDPNFIAPSTINTAIRRIVITGIVLAIVLAIALANDLDGVVTGWLIERNSQ